MREIAVQTTETEFVRLWHPKNHDRTLFVTYLTPESATRYQFNITDTDQKFCTLIHGEGGTPPRSVVELLNQEEFTVTNLPNITEEDPADKAHSVEEAIAWLQEHGGFEPGDLRTFAYERAQNVMLVIYGSQFIFETIGPQRYEDCLEDVLQKSGESITREDLLHPRTHNIEFLQKLLIELRKSLRRDEQEEIVEMAEKRTGWTAEGSEEEPSPYSSWKTETHGEERIQLNPDAVETLKEEGWIPQDM